MYRIFRPKIIAVLFFLALLPMAGAWAGVAEVHDGDTNADFALRLDEVLRLIQLYNAGDYRCADETEDGYAPGTTGTQACGPHDLDFDPEDWSLSLSELLRGIQFYNVGGYYCDDATPDGFRPGMGPVDTCLIGGEGEGMPVEGEPPMEGEGMPAEGEGQGEGMAGEGEGEGSVDGEGAPVEGEGQGEGGGGETIVVDPGEVLVGDEGVTVQAPDGVLAGVDLSIEQIPSPTDETPLPAGAEPVTGFFRVGASEDVIVAPTNPFFVGVPLPAKGGVDTGTLAFALLVPAASIDAVVPPGEDYTPTDAWFFKPAVFDPETGQVVTTAGTMPDTGQVFTIVSNPNFDSTSGFDTRKGSSTAVAECGPGFGGAPESCGNIEEIQSAAALQQVFDDLRSIGFKRPFLTRERVGTIQRNQNGNITTFTRRSTLGIELRPCSATGNTLGLYTYSWKTFMWTFDEAGRMWACLDGVEASGIGNDEIATIRHEYFHATQSAYEEVRDDTRDGSARDFWKEGMATASENSFGGWGRDTGRNPREVDRTLYNSSGTLEYRAQDFWLYVGDALGSDLDTLDAFLRRGANEDDIDDTIRNAFPGGNSLSSLYWAWVKNQAFESSVSFSGLGDPCVFDPNTSQDTVVVNFDPTVQTSLMQSVGNISALASEVVQFNLMPNGSSAYEVDLRIDEPGEPAPSTVKFYEAWPSATSACVGKPDDAERLDVSVPAGATRIVYALVGNNGLDNTRSFDAVVSGYQSTPVVEITEPVDGATFEVGTLIDIRADIDYSESGTVELLAGGSTLDTDTYDAMAPSVPAFLDTRDLCPSDTEFTVRFTDPVGNTFEDSHAITINGSSASMAILGPDPRHIRASTGTGGTIEVGPETLQATVDFPTCDDPLSERFDDGDIEWLDETDAFLSQGATYTVEPPFFDDGSGGVQERTVTTEFSTESTTVTDSVTLIPCSSNLGSGDPVPGLPECPTSAVAGDVIGDLNRLFGTSNWDFDDIERIIGIVIGGEFGGAIEDLGFCDPRVCDPPYPENQGGILAGLEGSVEDRVITRINDLLNLMDTTSPSGFRENVESLQRDIAADIQEGAITNEGDLKLLNDSVAIALSFVQLFASEAEGGANLWQYLSFLDAPADYGRNQANPITPAYEATLGYLDAANRTEDPSDPNNLEGAKYAGSKQAVQQAVDFSMGPPGK